MRGMAAIFRPYTFSQPNRQTRSSPFALKLREGAELNGSKTLGASKVTKTTCGSKARLTDAGDQVRVETPDVQNSHDTPPSLVGFLILFAIDEFVEFRCRRLVTERLFAIATVKKAPTGLAPPFVKIGTLELQSRKLRG